MGPPCAICFWDCWELDQWLSYILLTMQTMSVRRKKHDQISFKIIPNRSYIIVIHCTGILPIYCVHLFDGVTTFPALVPNLSSIIVVSDFSLSCKKASGTIIVHPPPPDISPLSPFLSPSSAFPALSFHCRHSTARLWYQYSAGHWQENASRDPLPTGATLLLAAPLPVTHSTCTQNHTWLT